MDQSISIRIPFEREGFLSVNMHKWKLQYGKRYNSVKVFLLFPVILLTIGFIAYMDEGIGNPVLFMGTILLTLGSLALMYNYRIKRRFYKSIKELADKYASNEMDCIYTISKDGVEYKDREKEFSYNWSVFSDFQVIDDTIFLRMNKNYINSIDLGKSEMSEKEYNTILKLINDAFVQEN